jgi:hypothetical protein
MSTATETKTYDFVLSAVEFTAKQREKEQEATGRDPGQYVYRLHRPTCDRLPAAAAAGHTYPVFGPAGQFAVPAENVVVSKDCTRCKPRTAEVREWAVTHEGAETAALAAALGKTEPEPQPEPEQAAPTRGAAPVLAGPPATRHPQDGRVMGLTSARYPEVTPETTLWCAACEEEHPAQRFAYLVRKGTGDGRPVVCRKADTIRIENNKVLRAEGKTPVPAPRLDPEHVMPKG